MAYWLLKSEPSTWSWDDQKQVESEGWNGVRNYQASNNMKAMQIGDLAFFYHSVSERQIVGIVQIVQTYHPDPTDATGRFGMVSVAAYCDVETPVTLAEIKTHPDLQEMTLVRQSRLSVCPIADSEWHILCDMLGMVN